MPSGRRIYVCHCGIFCKTPTEVSHTTYANHQRAVEAVSGTVLPAFQPTSAELQAVYAQRSAENAGLAASSSRKRMLAGPEDMSSGSGSGTGKRRKAAKRAVAEDQEMHMRALDGAWDSPVPQEGVWAATAHSTENLGSDEEEHESDHLHAILISTAYLVTSATFWILSTRTTSDWD
ncbi:uncharacterized protein PHACADRAFT_34038 [Phanerochaete carnosa HHB-10118-sp]|uniref:Uncharacterized protein n=1 Tax=Phanerochaete carnosa (strain HHB-10118-sp) TaxID=650164 RepID=K5VN76_PHACS|nr:uncharacterized protein PHACADRAFT_34038 [Phanerochaete carnosa HHB-10118-sp]EKM48049.1 hypothetical protein PHACADRAFT_34038 [Phanerochaete carnosa HHB-10118-sp]